MTRQEVVDKLYQWFIVNKNPKSQGTMGNTKLNVCQYRLVPGDPESPRCSVGVFIPDALYTRTMEGGLHSLLEYNNVEENLEITDLVLNGSGYKDRRLEFWTQVQRLHDCSASTHFTRDFDKNLRTFITDENLVYPGE